MDENKFEVFTNDMKVKPRVKCGGVAVGGQSAPVLYINGGSEVLEVDDIQKFRTAIDSVITQSWPNVTKAWRKVE